MLQDLRESLTNLMNQASGNLSQNLEEFRSLVNSSTNVNLSSAQQSLQEVINR